MRWRAALRTVAGWLMAAASGTVQLLAPSYTGENRMAPDFDLVDAQGRHHRLGDYRGRTLVLHFWSSTCQPCVSRSPRSHSKNRIARSSVG